MQFWGRRCQGLDLGSGLCGWSVAEARPSLAPVILDLVAIDGWFPANHSLHIVFGKNCLFQAVVHLSGIMSMTIFLQVHMSIVPV